MKKTITITRDSVAAGDDGNAPHYLDVEIDTDDKINDILLAILELPYLPQIRGDKATWSVASNQPLAIIAQEWPAPKLICYPDYPFQNTRAFYNIEKLHFNYHAQDDPELVFRVLYRFKVAE